MVVECYYVLCYVCPYVDLEVPEKLPTRDSDYISYVQCYTVHFLITLFMMKCYYKYRNIWPLYFLFLILDFLKNLFIVLWIFQDDPKLFF